MKSTRWVLVSWLLIVMPLVADTADKPRLSAARSKAIDQAIQDEMKKDQIVGLALGIIEDGEIVYLKGYGFEDRERKLPVTGKTLFRWASCSKPVTAIAAMQLVEQGKLDLDADVRKLVPEFPDKGVKITPRFLLCHQSGIVHYTNGKVIRTKRTYPTKHPFKDVVLALDTFKESPLVHPPGEKVSYTTHGYVLLSAVVERAGKQPFATQVHERIAKPLAMTTFQPDYQWINIPHRAVGYRKMVGIVVPSTNTDVSWKLGGGGYLSNVEDFARFARGLLQGKLISKQTEELTWTPQKLVSGKVTAFGLGFQVSGKGDQLRVAHSGAQEKTRTRMVLSPHTKRGIVVMTNSEWVNPSKVTTLVLTALNKAK